MDTHDEFAALLDAFVDGELAPAEADRVRAHLAACPACQAYVADALAIREAFPEAEDTVLPEGFTDAVMAAVRTHPQKKKVLPWRKVLLPLAACFALVLLVRHMPLSYGGGAADTASVATASAADTAEMAEDIQNDGGVMKYKSARDTDSAPEAAPEAEGPAAQGIWDSASAEEDAAADHQELMAAQTAIGPGEAEPYFAQLRLTAEEAGDLLVDLTPVEESETELRYELDAAGYSALTAALAETGIALEESAPEDDSSGTALVIVEK